MAVPTNSYLRTAQVGVREALEDAIYNLSPEDTPVASEIGKKKTPNTFYEWQTDALRAANKDNAMIESDDFTAKAITPTKRLTNHCQIFNGAITVSNRASKADAAGRAEEMAYQIEMEFSAMKTDVEAAILSNNVAVAPVATTTAPKLAGFGACIDWASAANGSLGATGVQPAWNAGAQTAAVTPGTARPFTEALLKQVMQAHYEGGGKPRMLVMSPNQKVKASAFTGIAQLRKDVAGKNQATITGAADVYVSDWGDVSFVPDRFCANTVAFGIDPDFAVLRVHRAMDRQKLAKLGDYERYGLLHDCTLQVKNPRAHFKIDALTP